MAAAGAAMEKGTGKELLEITGPALSKRKLLVGLDLLCLFLGEYEHTSLTYLKSTAIKICKVIRLVYPMTYLDRLLACGV